MSRIDTFKKYHGQTISNGLLKEIENNFFMSRHAQEQLSERSDFIVKFDDGRINFGATKQNIKNAMDKNILAYFNTDGSVNVALDEQHYFVFAWDDERDSWTMITYKEPSWFSINIFEKQKMALEGFDRQYD